MFVIDRCRSCLFTCSSLYHYQRHVRVAHRCIIKSFPALGSRLRARKVRRRPSVRFECGRCDFRSTNKHEWAVHINWHAVEQLRQLQTAGIAMRSKGKTPATDNSLNCPECDFTCRRKDMYVAHMKQHSKKSAVSKCDQCPYTTSNPYNLMKHKRTHTGEKPFKCSYCPYRSADSGNLNKHINSHHGINKSKTSLVRKKTFKPASKAPVVSPAAPVSGKPAPTPPPPTPPPPTKPRPITVPPTPASAAPSGAMQFKCTECDYICNNEEFLVAHLSIHRKHGDQYVCAVCNYASRNQQNLAKHIRTHTGEKPYKCIYCSYSAADKGNLNKHIKTHHKQLAQKPSTPASSKPTDSSPALSGVKVTPNPPTTQTSSS